MKCERDYSQLGEGAARLCLLHPFCLWPDVQESILGNVRCTEMASLSDLDEAACARVVDWRLGWTALEKHLQALDFVETPPDVTIVDFSSVQADGGAGLREKLRRSVFHGASHTPARRPFAWCAHRDRWDDSSWARWYGGPCFSHDRSAAIQKPLKAPVPSSALPPFLRPALVDASRAWARLVLLDRRALPPVAAPSVDAVHDWACASYGRADDGVLIEAERVVVGGAAVVTPSPSPAPY